MLVGVTLVGALRQRVDKTVAFVGGTPSVPRRGRVKVRQQDDGPLWTVSTPFEWLGGVDARDAWAGAVSEVLSSAGKGVAALPPGIRSTHRGRPYDIPAGTDVHVLEVASADEQATLCNLLRRHLPVVIGLTGRQRRRPGHTVATRHLDSTDARFQAVLAAHLRRTAGIAALDRMDVYPAAEPDGTPTVVVQCVDAAPTMAAVRAHAVLLNAFALRARRMARDGEAVEHTPQHTVDEDRARATARGLRARVSAGHVRDQAEHLLRGPLARELANLEATAEELFPVIARLELPACGLAGLAHEDTALGGADPATVPEHTPFWDTRPGGPHLAAVASAAPGRADWVTATWNGVIADRGAAAVPRPRSAPDTRGPAKKGRAK
jgi:hypothetical protein